MRHVIGLGFFLAGAAFTGCQYMEVRAGDRVLKPAAESPAMATQRQEAEARERRYASMPKRAADSPIVISLYKTVMAPQLEKSAEKFFSQFRAQFEGHPVLRLNDQKQVEQHEYQARTTTFEALRQPIADVDIRTFLSMKDEVVQNRANGKLASAQFLVYRAELTSPFLAKTYTVSDEGFWLQSDAVLKRFAESVKKTILDEIGPRLPAQRKTVNTVTNPKDLKSLFRALGQH